MRKPTAEDRDNLLDLLLNHDGAKVLLDELERDVDSMDAALVKLTLLDSEDDERRLLRLKLEAQGSRKLFLSFRDRLSKIRLAALKADVPE